MFRQYQPHPVQIAQIQFFNKFSFIVAIKALAKGFVEIGLKRLTCLSVRQKITYGYALAISIAVLGAGIGFLIEQYHTVQARQILGHDREQVVLLRNLEAAVLQAQSHQQILAPLLAEPQKFEHEYSDIRQNLEQAGKLLAQAKTAKRLINLPDTSANGITKYNLLIKLPPGYEDTVASYSQGIVSLVEKIKPSTFQAEELAAAQKALIAFANSEVSMQFHEFSEKLTELVSQVQVEEAEAFELSQKAEQLENLILLMSLMISAAIAAVLAKYTSRAIAHPLEAATKVAQQVSKEANFSLQAPVTTEDEVGLLTTSLNQLIQRVAAYTEEVKQTQAHLIQTEKMSSLGSMVAGIAHELNNPTSVIKGNLLYTESYMLSLLSLVRLYQEEYPQTNPRIEAEIESIDLEFLAEDIPKMLNSMKIGSQRISQLVLSLRNFSRLDESPIKKVDLHEGINNTLVILSHSFKQEIEVIKQYGDLSLVECYPAQLNQVFLHIINNAVDALFDCEQQTDKQIVIQTEPVAPFYVRVRIRDNGCGMTPNIQDKIFDPFFTTKPVGRGTGLGLAIAYQIIQKHGGTIEVNSWLGQGTEFTITLPIKQSLSLIASNVSRHNQIHLQTSAENLRLLTSKL